MLVMDNASFHFYNEIVSVIREANVRLLYLPMYFPDLNPIKAFFYDLKAYICKHY